MTIDWQALAAPFPPDSIEWRVGQRSKAGDKATVLAYLTSRAVMDRLDEVVGPDRWRDSYQPLTDASGKVQGFMCTLEIEVQPGQWVGRTDVSDTTDIEALKGGVSGALKRAAVKWGIGRYLYGLDSIYLPIVDGYPPRGSNAIYCPKGSGKTPGHVVPPALPKWALPSQAPQGGARHHPTWRDAQAAFCAQLRAIGCTYEVAARIAEARGRPRPSAMDPDQRQAFLGWLGSEKGRAAIAAEEGA